MGLDTVEMVIEVEDRFGIRILATDAEQVLTVGDLYQLVLRLIASTSGIKCKTQHVFYRLRKSLPYHLRDDLRPNTALDRILPRENIKAAYADLQKEIGLSLPRLEKPGWYSFLALFTVLSLVGLIVYLFHHRNPAFVEPIMLLWFCVRLNNWLHDKVAVELPGKTVRDLVFSTTIENYKKVLPRYHNENEVLDILKVTIVDKIGVELSDLTLDARFSEDLGMD